MTTEINSSVNIAEMTSKKRLQPVRRVLFEENISYAQLAQACKCSKQNMSLRFINDDCKLSDMEKMAEAIGYDFSWTFTKKKKARKTK
jgi:hypothetical protein